MSQQNVEVIRAAFDAYNARDMDRRRIRAKRRALSRTSRIMAWRPPFGTFIYRPRSAIATLRRKPGRSQWFTCRERTEVLPMCLYGDMASSAGNPGKWTKR
jgi:hypothetical protein